MSKSVAALIVGSMVCGEAWLLILGVDALLRVMERDLSIPRPILAIAALAAGAAVLWASVGRKEFRSDYHRRFDGLVGQPVIAMLSLPALGLYLRFFVIAAGCVVFWRGLLRI